MIVVLAADHRGLEQKEKLKQRLQAEGHAVEDVGAHELTPTDDYPDFALLGAVKVAEDAENRGVFLCGSGMGMDIVANKVKGIRATIALTKDAAAYARDHDDVNVITLAADTLKLEESLEIVRTFLTTPFSSEERHMRRVKKILAIEEERMK